MILIKSIEIIEVPEEKVPVYMCPPLNAGDPIAKDTGLTDEMVQGRVYDTVDGRKIVIGMTEAVQEAIGLPYEAFEVLRNNYEHAVLTGNNHYRAYCTYRNRIVRMSFWQRLWALFFGYI